MKILSSWLNELAPVGHDADALFSVLNDLGLAVDDVVHLGAPVPGVVVAKVLETRRHPKAERVQEVFVDAGDGPRHVWCGAFNMAAGDLVPLATIGTVMPDGREIQRRKILGEASEGMLCSQRELGLGEDAAGIWILPPGLPLGVGVFEAMAVTPDVLFDLDVPRNRPDCWSYLGVARDLAARLGLPFTPPAAVVAPAGPSAGITVAIDDTRRCGRFTAALVTGVRVGPSPAWIAERLTRAGMRPINNVVDVSNYLMLELGRPNHAYDLAKLGGGGFLIRAARHGETIETLDGVVRALSTDDCLICDATDVPVGIGGIMGGANSEIDDTTTTVALESAWFDPVAIASTASRLGLRTEASARFERGCNWDDMHLAASRFVELLRHTCPDARLHELVDARGELPDRSPITVRVARVNRVLGTDLGPSQMKALLDPIGFAATVSADGSALAVTLPTWRYDATEEIDVVEEVARLHGYSRIAKTVPTSTHPGTLAPHQEDRRLVRGVCVGLGLSEAMPNPFLAPGDLERCGLPGEYLTIANPLVAEESVLRTSLLPGLVGALAYNASHRRTDVGLFEIGHVYRVPADASQLLPDEREHLAVAWHGRDGHHATMVWRTLAAALALRDVEIVAAEHPGLHPTRSAVLVRNGLTIGAIGEIDPRVVEAHGFEGRVAWVELDLGEVFTIERQPPQYVKIRRFPSSDLDLAFVVDDAVPAGAVETTIRRAGGELVVAVELFDVYRGSAIGDGRRSLAYRLRLQAPDRTLTDADVASVRVGVVDAVTATHGASLRG